MNIDKIDKEEKFEKDLKEMFRKEMVLDDESEIYKELAENGKITEFENLFVDDLTRWKERTWCSSIFIVWGAII